MCFNSIRKLFNSTVNSTKVGESVPLQAATTANTELIKYMASLDPCIVPETLLLNTVWGTFGLVSFAAAFFT